MHPEITAANTMASTASHGVSIEMAPKTGISGINRRIINPDRTIQNTLGNVLNSHTQSSPGASPDWIFQPLRIEERAINNTTMAAVTGRLGNMGRGMWSEGLTPCDAKES